MSGVSRYIDDLVKRLSRLPGVGPKSASRLAFHILKMPREEVESLARALVEVKDRIRSCRVCFGISDGERCTICADPARDGSVICAVEQAKDVLTIESTGEFHGRYHVLGGLISPLDGVGPDELHIGPLVARCREGGVTEVILAFNPSVEGEATSLYVARELRELGVRVTRIARGLPVGADIEFADRATIARSIQGRMDL